MILPMHNGNISFPVLLQAFDRQKEHLRGKGKREHIDFCGETEYRWKGAASLKAYYMV